MLNYFKRERARAEFRRTCLFSSAHKSTLSLPPSLSGASQLKRRWISMHQGWTSCPVDCQQLYEPTHSLDQGEKMKFPAPFKLQSTLSLSLLCWMNLIPYSKIYSRENSCSSGWAIQDLLYSTSDCRNESSQSKRSILFLCLKPPSPRFVELWGNLT